MGCHRFVTNKAEKKNCHHGTCIIAIILLLLMGIMCLNYICNLCIEVTTNHAVSFAASAESLFPSEIIKKIEYETKYSKEKIEYQKAKNSLIKLTNVNNNVRCAYIYTLDNGKEKLLVDSVHNSFANDFYIWKQSLSESEGVLLKPFETGAPYVSRPRKDKFGKWISVLVPMEDPETQETLAVLALEYPESIWRSCMMKNALIIIVVLMCLIMIICAYYELLRRNTQLREQKQSLEELYKKLIEKKELFRMVFEQSPMGIAFCNSGRYVLDCNNRFEEIVGRNREELRTISWTKTTHLDVIEYDQKKYLQMLNGEIDGYSMQKRYIKSDGTTVWVNVTISRLVLEAENEITYVCIVEDFTERMKTEANLRESERSQAVLLSNLPGLAYRCDYDRNWTMRFVSQGCFELTGYKPESLLGNKKLSFNELINSEMRDLLWKKWNNILKNKGVFKEEYEIITATGEKKWVLEQGRGVYGEDNQVEAIEGLIIDITESKKKDEEIRYLHYHDALTGLFNRTSFHEAKMHLDNESHLPLSVIVADINGLKLINDAFGHAEGDKLIVEISRILKKCCREKDFLARISGDDFGILLPQTNNEELTEIIYKLRTALENQRVKKLHASISLGWATKISMEETLDSIVKSAEEHMHNHKLLESRSAHSSILSSMKTTLFEKSQETEEHALRLVELSKEIGIDMKLKDVQLGELELLSTLHDIGKIGISDVILKKPSKLTAKEWIEMKKHPEIGYRIAMSSQELYPIAEYILSHHERWDGKGYPRGLKGEEIPLLSRILAVVDSYDAMTQKRSYREVISKEEAIIEIRNNAGTQFDPEVAEVFIKILESGRL